MVEKFINIFEGLKRAHGCTYINSAPKNGTKLKTKSFVKRETVTNEHFENHLKGIEPTLGIIPINENNLCRERTGFFKVSWVCTCYKNVSEPSKNR